MAVISVWTNITTNGTWPITGTSSNFNIGVDWARHLDADEPSDELSEFEKRCAQLYEWTRLALGRIRLESRAVSTERDRSQRSGLRVVGRTATDHTRWRATVW